MINPYEDEHSIGLIPGRFYRNRASPVSRWDIYKADAEGIPKDKYGQKGTLHLNYSLISNSKKYALDLRKRAKQISKGLNEDADFLEKGLEQLVQPTQKGKRVLMDVEDD